MSTHRRPRSSAIQQNDRLILVEKLTFNSIHRRTAHRLDYRDTTTNLKCFSERQWDRLERPSPTRRRPQRRCCRRRRPRRRRCMRDQAVTVPRWKASRATGGVCKGRAVSSHRRPLATANENPVGVAMCRCQVVQGLRVAIGAAANNRNGDGCIIHIPIRPCSSHGAACQLPASDWCCVRSEQ